MLGTVAQALSLPDMQLTILNLVGLPTLPYGLKQTGNREETYFLRASQLVEHVFQRDSRVSPLPLITASIHGLFLP